MYTNVKIELTNLLEIETMSLEKRIADLTKVVESLVEAVGVRHSVEDARPAFGPDHMALLAKQKSEKKGAEKPKAFEGVDYSEVKAAALELAQKGGRDTLTSVLKASDLKTAREAKPDQYPALLADLQQALADLQTDPA